MVFSFSNREGKYSCGADKSLTFPSFSPRLSLSTSGLDQPWPGYWTLVVDLKRHQGCGEAPSGIRWEGYLEQRPRSLRGFHTVNLADISYCSLFMLSRFQ